MKRLFITVILSAALMLSACSAQEIENPAEAEQTEAASTTPVTTSTYPVITSTAPITTTTTPITAEPKKFPGETEIHVTYQSFEDKQGKPCRCVMDGLEYEDFPAKEDIEPAIKCAYDYFFSKTNVYHLDENGIEEALPCTIENLSFVSGLYLDFNGDGEKESIIVVENDSEWYSYDSIAVYYRNESDNAALGYSDKLFHGYLSRSSIQALIYDDCADVIVEELLGPSGQEFTVYSFDNGCKKEFMQGKGGVYPVDTCLCSYSWYGALGGDPPTYYIRTDNGYSHVGMDEIRLDALIEKIPEMHTFVEMIEDYYEEEIVCVKTEGYLNFFFCMKDKFIRAHITGDTLRSDFQCRSIGDLDYRNSDGEVVYGLCLL